MHCSNAIIASSTMILHPKICACKKFGWTTTNDTNDCFNSSFTSSREKIFLLAEQVKTVVKSYQMWGVISRHCFTFRERKPENHCSKKEEVHVLVLRAHCIACAILPCAKIPTSEHCLTPIKQKGFSQSEASFSDRFVWAVSILHAAIATRAPRVLDTLSASHFWRGALNSAENFAFFTLVQWD